MEQKVIVRKQKIKNIDSLGKAKVVLNREPKKRLVTLVKIDSVQKRLIARPKTLAPKFVQPIFHSHQTRATGFKFYLKELSSQKKVPITVAVVGLVLAFAAGSWSVLSTYKSEAETVPQVLSATTNVAPTENNALKVSASPVGNLNGKKIPSEKLLSLTMDQLESYLNEALKTPEAKQAEILAERKEKLKIFLTEKKSPFVSIVDTIAELKHWKLVLAISNSESTLGKRCYTNNCSGIGVEPGHPLWREYKSTADWAKDLDRLLEKRYKDWTLEEMNGVYNQPGSENWIFAATQIIEALKERGIE